MHPQRNQTVQEGHNQVYTLEDFLSTGEQVETEEKPEPTIEDTKEEEVEEEQPKPKAKEKEEEQAKPESKSEEEKPELSEEEEESNPAENPTVYAELLSTYIEEGDWDDAIVEIDGEEV